MNVSEPLPTAPIQLCVKTETALRTFAAICRKHAECRLQMKQTAVPIFVLER
jgi:hypothetical protein